MIVQELIFLARADGIELGVTANGEIVIGGDCTKPLMWRMNLLCQERAVVMALLREEPLYADAAALKARIELDRIKKMARAS